MKNIKKLLEKGLPKGALRIVRRLGRIANEQGLSAYLVGGCVRDLLLGEKVLDLDIVVTGNALSFIQALPKTVALGVLRHPRFGTATLTCPGTFKIDVVSARKEYYAQPAVLPAVLFSSIQDDLFRRDFTINALAAGIGQSNFGELLDPFGGQRDLAEGKIRVMHKRSFIDDPTRILRAIRFEQRFNFKIEPQSFKLMRQAIAAGHLAMLSRPRLGKEFILILKEKKLTSTLLRFEQLCGLKLIHPLIKLDRQMRSQLELHKAPGDWRGPFAVLTKRLNEQQLEKLCSDFCLTRKDKQRLKTIGVYLKNEPSTYPAGC